MSKSNVAIEDQLIENHESKEEQEEEKTEWALDPAEILSRDLHSSEISVRLSWLGKTAGGDGYTYLKATCTNLQLTNIKALTFFKHLQFVDLSHNMLTLEALQLVTELPFLLLIQADNNLLRSANLNKCKYLQVIIMNHNQLTSVEDVFQPELSTLEVGYNNITQVKFINRMETIRVLDFRYNMIQEIDDLKCEKLDSLYLAGNKIKEIFSLQGVPNLRVLHLRNNPIRKLTGFDEGHAHLRYLNLRSCMVRSMRQIKCLRTLSSLETLVLKNTPFMGGKGQEGGAEVVEEEEDPDIRVQVFAALPRLKKLNKTPISPEERFQAKEVMTQWLEEGEPEDVDDDEEEHLEEEEK